VPETPESRREYAERLEATSKAYATAADAVGLRKDAARYLYSEALRLHREAVANMDRADEIESDTTGARP
jgi:hypothetical protein